MAKMDKITLNQDCIRITVVKFEKRYLATVDHIDEDGDVEFGSSGDFANKAIDAVRNAIYYYRYVWDEPVYQIFNVFK